MRPTVLELPRAEVHLKHWRAESLEQWTELGRRAESLNRRAGAGKNFGELIRLARELLLGQDIDKLTKFLAQPGASRALITVWSENPALARASICTPVLDALRAAPRPTRLATIILAVIFLEHFDEMERWETGLFAHVADTLRTMIEGQPVRETGDIVDIMRNRPTLFMQQNGPETIAAHLRETSSDVYDWFRENRLSPYIDSRFGRLARDHYYILAIRAADPETANEKLLGAVSREVVTRQRTETSADEQYYFGHQVLTELTAPDLVAPHHRWIEAMLEIGGDPRQRQTPKWRLWWSEVPEAHVARAVRWMSGLDLTAFLAGIQDYARETCNTDMERMLEARARLLKGLYSTGRVKDVRLILGDNIRTWVRSNAIGDLVDAVALRGGQRQDTAVIYLDCGDFYIVEGTHNFRLHIYLEAAPGRLADRGLRTIQAVELIEDLPTRHVAEHGYDSHFAVAHHGFAWVHKTLDFLDESGISVEESALMTPNEYAELLRRRARDYW